MSDFINLDTIPWTGRRRIRQGGVLEVTLFITDNLTPPRPKRWSAHERLRWALAPRDGGDEVRAGDSDDDEAHGTCALFSGDDSGSSGGFTLYVPPEQTKVLAVGRYTLQIDYEDGPASAPISRKTMLIVDVLINSNRNTEAE